jgi:hypothetical protein
LFGIANLEQKNIPLATTNIKTIRMGYHSERDTDETLLKTYADEDEEDEVLSLSAGSSSASYFAGLFFNSRP